MKYICNHCCAIFTEPSDCPKCGYKSYRAIKILLQTNNKK